MNRKYVLLTATTTLSLLTGAAAGAGSLPDCIASPQELDLEDIASRMIHSLPVEQQRLIAAHDGPGSGNLDLSLSDWSWADGAEAREAQIPSGITATQWLESQLTAGMRAKLTGQQLDVLYTMAGLMEQGQDLPFFCFAPDASADFAYMINQLLDYQFVSGDGSRFQQSNRWSRTATDGSGLGQGDATTITYSFVPDGTFCPNQGLGSGSSTLFAWLDGRYGDTETWQDLFHQVFDRWAELTGLSYVWEQNDDGVRLNGQTGILGVRGDVRIAAFNYPADGNGGVLAYNNFPNDGDMAIDAFDTFYNVTTQNSRRLRNVVAHEHGHGLGMTHVCPSSGTKLMEPFVSTGYDGPQLDDILNGQRHYGDPTEPNENQSTAIPLGTHADSAFETIENISIDDNGDYDLFKLTLTTRAMITFAIAPSAGTYRQGPQTQACNTGTNTNYNTMHDLKIDLYSGDDLITPLATEDSTVEGGIETMGYAAETAGDYYFIVSATTNTNNIQRYMATMVLTPLPPVECPADINMDGDLNFFDVSAFLSEFNGQTDTGDFNDDGDFNFFDVSAFLSAFSAGCP